MTGHFIADLSLIATALILATSFAGSFVTAAFGIGGGIITLAAIASLLPAAAIIPVHGAVQVGSNAGRLAVMRHHFDSSALLPFTAGALIGALFGGALVVELNPAVLRITLGLFILWTIGFKPPKFLAKSAGLVGLTSSFLTMFVGGTGPFVITFIRTLGLNKLGIVATHAGFMTLQHGLKTITFATLGFAFVDWLALITAMIAAGLLGTLIGKRVLMKLNEAHFKTILNGVLIVLALRLIAIGIWPWITSP